MRWVRLLYCFWILGFAEISAESQGQLNHQSPYLQHAPLAAFSVGSLAIGTVFYALQTSLDDPKVGFVRDDRTPLGTAVGAAGLTALVAGVSYFYFSNRDVQRAKDWDAKLSGSLAPNGEMQVSANFILPLTLLRFP